MKRRRILPLLVGGLVLLCLCSVIVAVISPNRGTAPSTSTSQQASIGVTLAATQPPAATSAATDAPVATQAPADTPTPAMTAVPADLLTTAAKKACGNAFVEATYTDPLNNGEGVAVVKCKLQENFDEGMMSLGALMNFVEITKEAMPRAEFMSLRYVSVGQFKDAYGNVSDGNAFIFAMPRALYDKINWANTLPQDVGRLLAKKTDGGSVSTHPAWSDAWAKLIGT